MDVAGSKSVTTFLFLEGARIGNLAEARNYIKDSKSTFHAPKVKLGQL